MTEIDVHVPDLEQLFDRLDPSPLASRDLDPRIERFIVDSAKDLPRDARLGLVVHVAQPAADTTSWVGLFSVHEASSDARASS